MKERFNFYDLDLQGAFKTNDEIVQYCDISPIDISVNEMGLHDFTLRKQHGWYTQEQYTVHFVLRGGGSINIAEKKHHVTANDIFVIPPNILRHMKPDDGDPWRYFWVGVSGNGIKELIKNAGISTLNPVYHCGKFEGEIRQFIDNIVALCPASQESMRLYFISYITFLFGHIIEEVKQRPDNENEFNKEFFLQQAIDIINTRYNDLNFRIEDICKQLAVSHSYLCRIFKEYSSKTLNQYLIRIRMRHARKMLESRDNKIQNIVTACGYTDYPYFAKEFKRIFNVTPSAYRKMHAEKHGKDRK
ncbi:MAG: AraC family transcriptional regulator [Clostridia bacterium]|nr:AraC family transcriptional regulator [Clostridia bacterium]